MTPLTPDQRDFAKIT